MVELPLSIIISFKPEEVKATGSLGKLIYTNGTIDIRNSTFKNNTTSNRSAAIYNGATEFEVANCLFENNASIFPTPYFGSAGAIYTSGYSTKELNKISNTKFIDNSGYNWGAVYIMSNGVEITNCVFEKNKTRITSASSNACGAISLAQQSSSYRVGPSVIKNSSFIENQSIGGTGAVYTYILVPSKPP
jgi:hypothetical protein